MQQLTEASLVPAFTPHDNIEWLVSPMELGDYAHYVHDRKKSYRQEGSILPLALARVSFSNLDPEALLEPFDKASITAACEIIGPQLVLLQRPRVFAQSDRPSAGWHVDRSMIDLPRTQGFRFQFSASHDPMLTTRYAPNGSPIIPRKTKRSDEQPEPPTHEVVRGRGDVIYLMPLNQSVHASPEKPTQNDAILLNRFAHFSFKKPGKRN